MLAFSFDWHSVLPSVWWTTSLVLMAIGLVGTAIPLLPGSTIILAGAVLHRFTLGEAHSFGWWTLGGLVALTMLSYGVDLASGTVGARWFGATRWGAIGGIIGTIVGLFFGLVGVFVAPVIGVLLGELIGGRGLGPASKSTWGTLLGTTAGIMANFCIGLVMVTWFSIAVFWR